MIANIGLRLDGYNQNVEYYVNQFSPFSDPDDPGQTNPEEALASSASSFITGESLEINGGLYFC